MPDLNSGLGRKVGEPNCGSRGASVNVELEVEQVMKRPVLPCSWEMANPRYALWLRLHRD